MGRPMSTLVAAEMPESRSLSGFRLAMLLPGALVTFLLILFALGLVLFLAFRGNDGSLLGVGLTVENFTTVATDPLYWTVTLRSLVIAGLVTLATVVTAYPVAYYLAFHAGRRRFIHIRRNDFKIDVCQLQQLLSTWGAGGQDQFFHYP